MSDISIRIGSITLVANDLERMTDFYCKVIGLTAIEVTPNFARLGIGNNVLLKLIHDPQAPRASAQEAGLFHIAFLLPARADLGRWLVHARQHDVTLTGAADHLVSEALYLADPEGNGIEIYCDRPAALWSWSDGQVEMANHRLDLIDLVAARKGQDWAGMPMGSTIGHVHLQVGDLQLANRFYNQVLGLDLVHRMSGAGFYSSDGYHHHIATNVWNSRGAGKRPPRSTGLGMIDILTDAPEILLERLSPDIASSDGLRGTISDPWGTIIGIRGPNTQPMQPTIAP
ncbi:VOC family protein [Paracoccus sp. Z330]|uniref:VOC family protein n=1 Tax=Paracoccus onchidii TaxID=3017813 RepID=A0ABT4ZH67_9RHOB|nr:VOC family protein [Paracoccus onchidii]MDB6178705.1 VOC family protein [Paracoccus onchidii]